MSGSRVLLAIVVQSLANFPTLSNAFTDSSKCDPSFTDNDAGKAYLASFSNNYTICKSVANFDQKNLCTCASNYLEVSGACHWDWMSPWVFTVKRDYNRNCWTWQSSSGDSGSASGAYSSHTFSAESDASSGGSDFSGSGNGSQASGGSMKPGQWVLVVLGIVCLLCSICFGAYYFFLSKRPKRGRSKAAEYDEGYENYAYSTAPPTDYSSHHAQP
mmetsp:Transcript_108315/g.203300  ORF Transcript_108315/g.203300 Transcript_108315/m.203300 type:complete len:216 (-) Transcript_108315:271-918(-)